MRWLIVFVAVIVSISAQYCDDVVLYTAQNNLNQALGIPDDPDYKNPGALQDAFNNLVYGGNWESVQALCKAFGDFERTLGNYYEPCMTWLHFLEHDQSLADSHQYSNLYHKLRFTCGAGFFTLMDNLECIQQTWGTSEAGIEQCAVSFGNSVTANPDGACSYLETDLSCVSNFFNGCGDVTAWWACESERWYQENQYDCPQRCNVSPEPVKKEEETKKE